MRQLPSLLVALLLVACQAPGVVSPAPSTVIGANAAEAVALASLDGGPDSKVVGSRLSTFGAEAPASEVADAGTVVWAVSLTGRYEPGSCGPATATPHPCPSPRNSALVLVDASTGTFIMGSVPDPGASSEP
jgi:hypothetical protein